jgi:hypothetical protein
VTEGEERADDCQVEKKRATGEKQFILEGRRLSWQNAPLLAPLIGHRAPPNDDNRQEQLTNELFHSVASCQSQGLTHQKLSEDDA